MKLYLTHHMFGDIVGSQLGSESDTPKNIFEMIYAWKHDLGNQKKFKIERYDRFIYHPKDNQIAIDFGDYSYFFLIDEVNNEQMSAFKEGF